MKGERKFKAYLEKKCKSDYEVQQHVNNVNYLNDWLFSNHMDDIIHVRTPDIMKYVRHTQAKGNKNGTINNRLNSIRKYYDCMIEQSYITRNPAAGIHIGRKKEKVVINPFSLAELNALYQGFENYLDTRPKVPNVKQSVHDLTNLRYKLIVSLMVYQGLDSGEIDRLAVSDVNLKQHTIEIAAKLRRKGRELVLNSSQILPFSQYMQLVSANQHKLFDVRVHDTLRQFMPILKGIEPRLKNAEHIRQSRIMIWVSSMKVLDAKELIGHKCVSSTESYQDQDTKELVDEINTLHLFR